MPIAFELAKKKKEMFPFSLMFFFYFSYELYHPIMTNVDDESNLVCPVDEFFWFD